jgi:hypothetical protein
MGYSIEKTNLGLDSQCFTYLISAFENVVEPTDTLSEEKKSLVWIYFYCSPSFWLSPKVKDEYDKIKDVTKHHMHLSWHGVHFHNFNPLPNPNKVEELAKDFKKYHSGDNDCTIIAEYKLYGINTVLSYDAGLINNLQNRGVSIIRPSEYWMSTKIPKGAKPKLIPDGTNPLSNQIWWRW